MRGLELLNSVSNNNISEETPKGIDNKTLEELLSKVNEIYNLMVTPAQSEEPEEKSEEPDEKGEENKENIEERKEDED